MAVALTVSALTCGLMFLAALKKPSLTITLKARNKRLSIGTYWIISLIGGVVLLAVGSVSLREVWSGISADTAINPLKILALFISMTALSVFLDEAGFFGYLAARSVSGTGGSQKRFFIRLYILVSLLTVFTSNDIVILTFTPFICFYAKNAGVNPVPYLVAEFVAANSLSLTFIIGNPTNVYLATFCGIGFWKYFTVMLLPAVFSGATGFIMTYLIFRKQLSQPIEPTAAEVKITDKPMLVVGLCALIACTVLLAISSYVGFEMWLVAVGFALGLMLIALIYSLAKGSRPTAVIRTLSRSPVELIPFVLSMFTIVMALDRHGVTERLSRLLAAGELTGISYGVASFLFANLINNIPMSVLFGSVTSYASSNALQAVYASVIGSNIGAFLTPVGALAGIMWLNILREKDIKFGFGDFVKYGIIISLPVLAAALGGMYLSLAIF